MSTPSSSSRAQSAVRDALAAPATLGELLDRLGSRGLVLGGLLIAALLGLFYQLIWRQIGVPVLGLNGGFSWSAPNDWGHAYVVPLIAGAYVWKKREQIAQAPVAVFWPGVSVILLGVVCYVYFLVVYSNHMFQGASALLALAGVVMLVFGPAVLRATMFPVAYLGLGLTISQMVMERVTFQLKLFASLGSHVLLNLIGIENDLRGNILDVYDGLEVHPLNVAEACSGMRMVVAFIALSVAVAFFSCRQWWQRIMIVMLALPVAVLMNVVRVTVLASLTKIDPDFSVGVAHEFIGTALLVPALMLFMFCVWAVKKITPDGEDPVTKGGASP